MAMLSEPAFKVHMPVKIPMKTGPCNCSPSLILFKVHVPVKIPMKTGPYAIWRSRFQWSLANAIAVLGLFHSKLIRWSKIPWSLAHAIQSSYASQNSNEGWPIYYSKFICQSKFLWSLAHILFEVDMPVKIPMKAGPNVTGFNSNIIGTQIKASVLQWEFWESQW